jgi:hypothetical protein
MAWVRLFGHGEDKVAKASTNPMQSEHSSDVKFEIGHVVFIDNSRFAELRGGKEQIEPNK